MGGGGHVIRFWIRLGTLFSLLVIPRSCGSQRKSWTMETQEGSALRLIPLQLVIPNELRLRPDGRCLYPCELAL